MNLKLVKLSIVLAISVGRISFGHADADRNADNLDALRWSLAGGSIVAVEYLVASSLSASIESILGHSAIRLVVENQRKTFDWVVAFVAKVPDDTRTLDKIGNGLIGSYPLLLEVLSFEQYAGAHVLISGRSIERIALPTDPEIASRLKRQLLSMADGTYPLGNYYFTFKNCLTVSLRFLQESGYFVGSDLAEYLSIATPFLSAIPAVSVAVPLGVGAVTPLNVENLAFFSNFLMLIPPSRIESPRDRIARLEKKLGFQLIEQVPLPAACDSKTKRQECLPRAKSWSDSQLSAIAQLRPEDHWFLFYAINPFIGRSHRQQLARLLGDGSVEFSGDAVFDATLVDRRLRHFCRDEVCARDFVDAMIEMNRNIKVGAMFDHLLGKLLLKTSDAKLQQAQYRHAYYVMKALSDKISASRRFTEQTKLKRPRQRNNLIELIERRLR